MIRGILAVFDDPTTGAIPRQIVFQYNPDTMTRVIRYTAPSSAATSRDTVPPDETYSFSLELDAVDAAANGGPISSTAGIGPQLAALEAVVQPVSESELGRAAARVLRGFGAVPPTRVPLVLLIWGADRVVPVRCTSLTVHELDYDEQLNPVRAKVDLAFDVLRDDQVKADRATQAAARAYRMQRELAAAFAPAQTSELT